MTNINNIIYQDQRRVILESLNESGFDANENMLLDCLELYGHRISQTLLRNHLLFLEDNGLISIKKISNNLLWVAQLTRTGEDVAAGKTRCEGIRKAHSNF